MNKKIKHFKNTPVVRSDGLDLNPETNYENLAWKTSDNTQDYQALDDRCKYDAYARKITYQIPEDATRNGFRIVIPSNPDLQATYQFGYIPRFIWMSASISSEGIEPTHVTNLVYKA